MSRVVVLGVQHQTYTNRKGDLVEKLLCYYFDPHEVHKSKLELGFRLLNQDVFGTFSFESFKVVPGVYEVTSEPILGMGGKLQMKFTSVSFVEEWQLDRAARGYLFLAAKKIDFQSDKGDNIRGTKLFFLNPRGYISSDEVEGYVPLEAFLPTVKLSLAYLPAFYHCEFDEVRGARGVSMAKIKPQSLSLIGSFGDYGGQNQEIAS